MRLPTPADLCWNVKCSPDQEWIERTLRIAVENVWPQALEAAHSRNGHGSHVVEIVESAIEHAVCRLKTGDPLGPYFPHISNGISGEFPGRVLSLSGASAPVVNLHVHISFSLAFPDKP
jgi:hypothetical protein